MTTGAVKPDLDMEEVHCLDCGVLMLRCEGYSWGDDPRNIIFHQCGRRYV